MVDGGPQATTMASSIRARYLMPKGGSERLRTTFSNQLCSLPSFSGAENAKLKDVLECIQGACKRLGRVVKQSGVAESHGSPGSVRWDQLQDTAEAMMRKEILSCPWVCAGVSPMSETIMAAQSPHATAKYVVVWDAMDGTSNLHAGVNTGTIFGVYSRVSPTGSEPQLRDALQPPSQLLCAGYAMYAAGTRLILASPSGADCFVLDDDLGHFVLSIKGLQVPENGAAYSVNEGNSAYWDEPTRNIVSQVKSMRVQGGDPLRLRYVGTMVADVHRTLLHGGLFMYPADLKSPSGKLRLLYEAGPIAYVFAMASGLASSGSQSIMSAQPVTLHQRTPVFLGSRKFVGLAQAVFAKEVLTVIDSVSTEREWVGLQRLHKGIFEFDAREGAPDKPIIVPDDYETLPEAISAACEACNSSQKGASQPPRVLVRAGEHSWQGTMQVKPGTVVVVEGEPGATTRGHWWLHAGSGGVIRGLKLEAVDNHVLTAYGGCWLLEEVEVSCVSGDSSNSSMTDDDYYSYEARGFPGARGAAAGFEAVQTFGQSYMTLKGCTLGAGGACGIGLFAYNNSCCCLDGCTIRGPAEQCVYVGSNAVVRLEKCTLQGEERPGAREAGLGVFVEHSGSALLRECDLASRIGVRTRCGGETSVFLQDNTLRNSCGLWLPAECRPRKYSEVGTKVVNSDGLRQVLTS